MEAAGALDGGSCRLCVHTTWSQMRSFWGPRGEDPRHHAHPNAFNSRCGCRVSGPYRWLIQGNLKFWVQHATSFITHMPTTPYNGRKSSTEDVTNFHD